MLSPEEDLTARTNPAALAARSGRRNTRTALAAEDGAFDLPSILVGVVTVGILTAGVLASIFGVIPFAQNNGAKADAAAVTTAEGVAKAKDGKFMDTAGLIAAGYLTVPTASAAGSTADTEAGFERTASTTPVLKYAVTTDPTGSCFLVVAHSDSGDLYYISNEASNPQVLGATDTPPCVNETGLRALIDAAGGDSSKRGPAAPMVTPTALPANGLAYMTWDGINGATGYRVETSLNGGAWATARTTTDHWYSQSIVATDTLMVRVITLDATSESKPSAVVTYHKPGYTNIFTNSGFENGTTGWTLAGGAATAYQPIWISGYGNLLIQDSTSGFTVSQTAAVLPGQEIVVSAKYQNTLAANGTLRFYDTNHSEIAGSSVSWTFVHDDYPTSGEFADGTLAPAGAAFASVTITTADGSGFTALDDVQLFAFK